MVVSERIACSEVAVAASVVDVAFAVDVACVVGVAAVAGVAGVAVAEDNHTLETAVDATAEAAGAVVAAEDEARHGTGFRLTAVPVDLHKYEA